MHPSPNAQPLSKPTTAEYIRGALYGIAAVGLWASWIVAVRFGIRTSLTPWDITAIRFAVAGAILTPYLLKKGFALDRLGWGGLHAAAIAAVGSLIAFVPVYAAISGARLFDAPWQDIALQAFVHGFLVAVISFVCIGRAVRILGASSGSAFAALAPAITTLLAIPILGEWPAPSDWIAMLLISAGVYIASGGPLPGRAFR